MQVTEQKMMSVIEKLCATPRDLPFQTEQGWMFSTCYMASYLQDHSDGGTGLSSDEAAMMAAGRLEWLLKETRPLLNGLFSERDVVVLLDCYQGGIFFPDQMNCIASDLCDHLGIDLDAYETSGFAPLVDKLRRLTAIQRVTLADVLEQTWHRGMAVEQKQPKEFWASLGITLM